MAEDGSDERPYVDTVTVPGVLVMPGDPDPTEFWSRYPEAFRVPVRIVWSKAAKEQDETPPVRRGNRKEQVEAPETAEMPGPEAIVSLPVVGAYGRDPVGMFLSVNDALDRLSGQDATEARPSTPELQPGGYVADDPRQWDGRPSVGTGECVPLVQQATGAPLATQWRPGAEVQGNTEIRPGTAIATFESNGHYGGHAAIYLGQDEYGIRVIDQWNRRDDKGNVIAQHPPSERTLPLGDPAHAVIDRGEYYRVVK